MKYVPAAISALAVGVGVCVALYLTKDVESLWGLAALLIVYWITPFQRNEY